ncbi:hypothetical protein BDF20DRAFT_915029 [Mycotypha africana]|uniref:uncharacterized protein n=1 Tax=Mycotypha africana TaxID=64632 RepID=UPI0023013D83|nr:uncharacterized protein BDF20DRAFT_915029 [Mycotypha africana]KAI8973611.1 hypothetical protein BDF20DRAFT_915029 [Mycotypha africana]
MRRNKTGVDRKDHHRRSWFNGSGLFNMFSSAPPSPTNDAVVSPFHDALARNRSQSLTPLTCLTPLDTAAAAAKRPTPLIKSASSKKMSFSSLLTKATAATRKKSASSSHHRYGPHHSSSNSSSTDMKKGGAHSNKASASITPDSFSTAFNTNGDEDEEDDSYMSPTTRRNSLRSVRRSLSDNSRETMSEYLLCTQPKDQPFSVELLELDEEEADRIQLKNDLMKLAFEGEFCLPFDYKDLPKGRILDVGCGPGAWCIDLSARYPGIEVIGVDKDDMFPAKHNLPRNCQLLVCNVLSGLREFSDASFDVIHIRFMVLSFTLSQYPQVIKDCWRLLKPGGYIEILETDLTIHSPGPITKRLNEEMLEVAKSRGLDPAQQITTFDKMIPENAIQTDVKYRSIPIGIWGGRIGVLCRDDMIHMLTRFQPAVRAFYGKSKPESVDMFDEDIKHVVREMDHYKSFCNYFFFTAQKPHLSPTNTPPASIVSTPATTPSSFSLKRNQLTQQSSLTSIMHPRAF